MAKKRKKTTNSTAWAHAKKVCRLGARHVQMAQALGMNPRKLPGLRPTPEQTWKQPVREFIEECYRKRFGGADSPSRVDDGRGDHQTPADLGHEMRDELEPSDDIPF